MSHIHVGEKIVLLLRRYLLLLHPEIGGELIRLLSGHRRVHKTKVVSKGLGGGCLHLGSERLLLRLCVDI